MPQPELQQGRKGLLGVLRQSEALRAQPGGLQWVLRVQPGQALQVQWGMQPAQPELGQGGMPVLTRLLGVRPEQQWKMVLGRQALLE